MLRRSSIMPEGRRDRRALYERRPGFFGAAVPPDTDGTDGSGDSEKVGGAKGAEKANPQVVAAFQVGERFMVEDCNR
jgi:hypothetical protein